MKTKIKSFRMASQEKVSRLHNEVAEVLEALGHPEALVTDESTVWDFLVDEGDLIEISEKLGFEVTKDDYIWELAERI